MNKLIRITATDPLRRHTTWYGYDHNGRVDLVWTAVDTVGSGTLLHGDPNNWDFQDYMQQRPAEASITYTYTPTGKVDTMYYPQINVATWYHYTPRKWLDSLVATNGLVDLFRQELSYNNVGHITKQYSEQNGATPNTQLYAYDAIGQLKTWSLNPLDVFNGTVQVYGYDDVGNRTSTTDFQGDPSTLQGSQSYSIGPDISNPTAGPNQLLKVQSYDATSTATDYTTFAYDPDGSMTVRTQYDPLGTPLFEDRYSYSSWRGLTTGFEREDLLVQPPAPPIVWTWEYRYNAMGEREQKREMASPSGANSLPGHSWSYYLLNGTKEQLSVWRGAETGSAGTCTWAQEQVAYLYPAEYLVYAVEYPGIREDIPRLSLTPDGDVEYRITDHLASVRQTLDNGGQVVNQVDYEPFGAVLSSQGVERQGFNSREIDNEGGTANHGVRKYSSAIGRFLSIDPFWSDYVRITPYAYSANSPMIITDPDGRKVKFGESATTADKKMYEASMQRIRDVISHPNNEGNVETGTVELVLGALLDEDGIEVTIEFADRISGVGTSEQTQGTTELFFTLGEGDNKRELRQADIADLPEADRNKLSLSRATITMERDIQRTANSSTSVRGRVNSTASILYHEFAHVFFPIFNGVQEWIGDFISSGPKGLVEGDAEDKETEFHRMINDANYAD